MKLRLLEYIICPDHPDEYLQLHDAHIAKLFDYNCEVRSPLCKNYCGLAQGVFETVPQGYIPDCRSCMSFDVEWGMLQCPECGGFYFLYEGIPVLTNFFPAFTDTIADALAAQFRFGKSKLAEYRRTGPFSRWADRREAKTLAAKLDLASVGSVLYLGGASPDVTDLFGESGVEMVIAGEDPDELIRMGEKELLNPSKLNFAAVSGPSPDGFRHNSFDLVISGYRLYGQSPITPPSIDHLVRTCCKSGAIALLFYRDNLFKRMLHLREGRCGKENKSTYKIDEFLDASLSKIPEMQMERHSSALFELIILRSAASLPDDIRTPFPGDAAEAMINA